MSGFVWFEAANVNVRFVKKFEEDKEDTEDTHLKR